MSRTASDNRCAYATSNGPTARSAADLRFRAVPISDPRPGNQEAGWGT